MSTGRRAASPLALLLGAALVAVVLVGVWLARQAREEPRSPTVGADAARATDGAVELPVPAFAVEPAAVDDARGTVGGAADGGSESSSGESAPAASFRALVVHADGTPAAGAAVVVAAGDVIIDSRITGPDGVAGFSITGGKADLYVGGVTLTPQHFQVEPAIGEHRLELPDGAFVGGLALVDGEPPAEPLELVFESRDSEDVWTRPPSVKLALESAGDLRRGPLGLHTTQGRFLLGGLPRDWAGWIEIPRGFRREGSAEREVFVPEPATDLVLRLAWDGALIGRVLLSDSSFENPHPAADATLELRVDRPSGTTFMASTSTDQEGRFRFALYSAEPMDVALQIRAADGTGRRKLTAEGLDPFAVHDLGDILLEPTQGIEFLVRDEAGQPLAGAVASALDETRSRSKPTGADGRGVLSDLMPGTTAVRIDALGRHPVEVGIAPPIEVVLLPAPTLDLRLVDESGAPPDRLVVAYDAEVPILDGGETTGLIDSMQVSLGATRFGRGFFDGAHARGQATLDDSARCLLTRIRAGLPFTLSVRDHYGSELRPPERLVLGPGEQRQLEWTVSGRERTVTVVVLTTEDEPVSGAQVWLRGSDPARPEADWNPGNKSEVASETGEVRFTNVFSERVSLQAASSRLRLGAAWLLDQHVPPEGARFELCLAPGRSIDIEVVGADGARRGVDDVSMIGGPVDVTAEQVEPGLYRLVNAPTGSITLQALLGRRQYSVQHEASQPRARIELPALGTLRARWTVPLEAGQPYNVYARCVQPDDWSRYFTVHDDARVSNGPIGFGDLLPGEYEVVLRQSPGFTSENPLVSQVARVTVRPGEVTEVLLEP